MWEGIIKSYFGWKLKFHNNINNLHTRRHSSNSTIEGKWKKISIEQQCDFNNDGHYLFEVTSETETMMAESHIAFLLPAL